VPPDQQISQLLLQLGVAVRESRRARRWTQRRLATDVGLAQSHVARIETGRVPDVTLRTAARLLEAAGGRLDVRFVGAVRTGATTQRDRAHASCVAYVARRLETAGFQVATEVEIGEGRWRTFADLLAFHPRERVLLVIEVKAEIHDVGEIDRQIGIAERGAWPAAHLRGWRPRAVVPVLLLLATRENDRRLADNRAYFDRSYPLRARATQAVVDGVASPADLGGRALAMIDPCSRRRAWLLPTWLDGRRIPAPHPDRVGYLARRGG
jgi:transcriptional regulator with XRE-family HTH domain